MLELKAIKKDYYTGGEVVNALKGIDLQFRESEFVSILGQSGCGKTTLLNLVGGLDQYTSGDLVINGKSTKDFKDRDWDAYRNHSVGFVFQSYNLIPHQSVLQNVELALSLSGVSKAERRKRAKQALEEVGLGSQIKKKPSQLSGGQMQRVAIARAIVNNPDIILADEPTGALDTETSVQVMEILKEISKSRLVIMVTHNPELAEKYSTRIIRMLDGKITDDSMPLTQEELQAQQPEEAPVKKKKAKKKPSMSIFTSFELSLKNLFTKKGRTILTSFAGSIGIIGIALIVAVSNGTTTYIDTVQEETLSSYPLLLESQNMDLATVMQAFIGAAASSQEHEKDAIYQKSAIYDMVNALNSLEATKNDLHAFKAFLEEERKKEGSQLSQVLNGIQYSYNFDLLVYTQDIDGAIIHSDSEKLMQELLLENLKMDLSAMMGMSEESGMGSSSGFMSMGSSMIMWQEMLAGNNGELINPVLKKQYELIDGEWPDEYNEIVLVVDKNNEIDDMALYALGLKTKEEISSVMNAALNKEEIKAEKSKWTYEEIRNREFKTILNSDCYSLNEETGLYTDLRETATGLKYLYDNGLTLKVSGIIRPNEDASSTMLSGSIAYTHKLTEYVIENGKKSPAIEAQLASPSKDIFTGLPFKENTGKLSVAEKETEFKKHIASLSEAEKAAAYIKIMSIPPKEYVDNAVSQSLGAMTREDMEKLMTQNILQEMGMSGDKVESYIASMSDEDLKKVFAQSIEESVKKAYAQQVSAQMGAMPAAQLSMMLDTQLASYTAEQCAQYYDEILVFSESTYDKNLEALGYVNLDTPSTISLYSSSFEEKDTVKDIISDYNKNVDELSKINYTDYVGIMMSSITTIINAITYVLIAFVAVSLIVSSIMIGVITLISVQERTKEIGILRAIGASKRNVSSMFNAETVIIGFSSGALGVIVTYLLCIPINIILHAVTGIGNLSAILPLPAAIILVIISVALTLFSGIIPSSSAAKKDPVVALRTE
ncbi:MAG: ABC transporter ATP-binding protein/permease [Ruminococcaceae bacterium]|nr:ABC transporter ATP-binding protein/permease [Oscillospiraceae bacterium]